MVEGDCEQPERRRGVGAWERRLTLVALIVCAATLAYFVRISLHWPMVWDETVIHTVNRLMASGMEPYRDIFDMNMPVMYLMDGWQMQVFGPGDLALRLYEFLLLAALLGSMMVIAGRPDWWAGLVAGTIFVVLHGAEGPRNAVQRDEVMLVLLMMGYALLFLALRRRMAWMLLPAGALLGMGAGIKPTILPWVMALAAMVLVVLRRRGEPYVTFLQFGYAGAAIPAGLTLGFLLQHRALRDFLDLSMRLTPYYGTLASRPVSGLLLHGAPAVCAIAAAFALSVAVFGKSETRDWERWALALGVAGGYFSYVLQRKGFAYQRYPLLGFGLLWICLELAGAIRRQGWVQWAGAAGLLYCMVGAIPYYARQLEESEPYDVKLMHSLEDDLIELGGNRLQGQVQCLDMVDGCLGALYHLGVVQNTGFTGDTLFFVPGRDPVADHYRGIFLRDVQTAPPRFFVVTNEWFGRARGFTKLGAWPEFSGWLGRRYWMVRERDFDGVGYRIYVRK